MPAEDETPPREQESAEGSDLREGLRATPDMVRDSVRDADERLGERVEERPALGHALDWRVAAGAFLIALVVAFVLRLLGMGLMVSFILFVALFVGLWGLGARVFAPARRGRPAQPPDKGEPDDEDEQRDDEGAG